MAYEPFVRHPLNPLITPDDLPIKANAVFNPGVVELDGEVLLLLRIEDRRGVSQIRIARSTNGIDGWTFDDHPLLEPDLADFPFEEWGCEDARVTQIAERKWVIAYTALSRYGPAIALAVTEDFRTVERQGIVMSPTNKDAAIFPQKFGGRWIMLHRPVTGEAEHIWYATSPDHIHWANPGVLLPERGGPWWDGVRIGVGAPPIRTDEGWVLIYHGVKEMGNRPIYRLGVAVLDLEDPRRALHRASEWVFGPEAPYEHQGLMPGVVFTCGTLQRGDEVWMYYGAADTIIGLATARMKDILAFARQHDFLSIIKPAKGTVT